MNKNFLIVIGIIILFLGVGIQPAIADKYSNQMYDNKLNKVDSDKPDLIIKNVFFRPLNLPPGPGMRIIIRIKNIGAEKVQENEEIKISIVVKKWKYFTHETYDITIEGGLNPGKRIEKLVDYDWYYPPGPYRFICTVNADKTIEESDYLNNYYSERDFRLIFLLWIDLTWL